MTVARATTTTTTTISSQLRAWLVGIPAGWRTPGWPRQVAIAALVGVSGDGLTTSVLPLVPGAHEANPVTVAGAAALGSLPLYMLAVSVPLLVLVAALASRPRSAAAKAAWAALALIGAAKLVVTFSNLVVLHAAVQAATVLVA